MLKGLKLFTTLTALSSLSACVSPVSNYAPEQQDYTSPAVGDTSTVSVGEKILLDSVGTNSEAIEIKEQERVGIAYTVFPGHFLKQGETDEAIFYKLSFQQGAARIERQTFGEAYTAVMVRKEEGDFCIVTVTNAYACDDEVIFEKSNVQIESDDYLTKTLIYNGKVGNIITIGYEEEGPSTPESRNVVQYDISESPIINYKSATIEVLRATKSDLKYRVISTF